MNENSRTEISQTEDFMTEKYALVVRPGLQSHLKLGVHVCTEAEPNGSDDK